MPFAVYVAITVVLAIAMVAGISPLMWDAAGYINEIATCVANLTGC
jgi:hypothetical protein